MSGRLPTIGETFAGRFVVEAEIGRGGFGVVYRAMCRQTHGPCALKVLTAEALFDDDARARFLQEARRTPWQQSAHVVRVIDADTWNGVPWIAMELLRGRTLDEHVRTQGPLSRRDFARFMAEFGDGVSAAHARGLVHRDLKPENIFLHQTVDGGWTVKVLDFGVAKQLGARLRDDGASIAVRTDGWGAPEQAILTRISPAADVWSMGLLAYFACTGRSFFGDRAIGETVVPASVRARSQGVSARLPPGFDAWFSRCVSWDPAQRHQDARQALDAARPLFDGALPPPAVRPRHLRWGVALVLIAAILVASGWLLGHHTRLPDPTSPGAPAAASDPTAAIAHAWSNAMEGRDLDPTRASQLYAPAVRINGDRRPATPLEISRHWTRLFALRGWRFEREPGAEWHLSSVPPLALGEPDRASCGDRTLRRAAVRMVQHQPARDARTGGNLPCDEVRGTYRLLLRATDAGWRICSETFLRSDLCAACPQARICATAE
ncbi:MAG: serine/threonine-protein kinase [Polyangiales bacterium]